MNLREIGALVDYLRTVPDHSGDIGACFDGYIFVQDDGDDLDSDRMYELGFTWDRHERWYAFDADRGV